MSTDSLNILDDYRSVCAAIKRLIAEPTRSESISTASGGSRTVTYADLAQLTTLRKDLETRLAAIGRGCHKNGAMGYARYV